MGVAGGGVTGHGSSFHLPRGGLGWGRREGILSDFFPRGQRKNPDDLETALQFEDTIVSYSYGISKGVSPLAAGGFLPDDVCDAPRRGPRREVHPIFEAKEQVARIRIVLLLQDLFFGGTQRHALELGARLDPSRFQVEVWTLAAGEDFLPLARHYGLSVRLLSRSRTVGPGALFTLWRALRADPPDILVPLTVVPNIWGRVLGRLAGVGTVVGNCRGAADPARQHEWLLWPLAGHVLCNASAIKARLSRTFRVPADRITVIRNGVNTEHYAPPPVLPDGEPVILCVARMDPVKDHATLLAAFDLAAAALPEARLWLVGDGPIRNEVTARARQSPFADRITITPGDADLRPYYARAGVLVLASRHEGLPNVVLEAMASGVPVAATAVGGVPELVVDGVTGRLVPPGQADALAKALCDILGDAQGRAAMGEAARRRAVEEFSLEAMARRHEEAFLRAVENRGRD
ncbi:glycosyltransferase [Desulfolutivibrio sulfoxidireducens]|nr:glycosyltransferase [Desulfolutivibrio sulfoxidireducens]